MTFYAAALLAFIAALLVVDYARVRDFKNRTFLIEALVFAAGSIFIVTPDLATRIAHALGIGRGVDFIIYPLIIWLVRESLVGRQRRWQERRRFTALVRALAIRDAHVVGEGRAHDPR